MTSETTEAEISAQANKWLRLMRLDRPIGTFLLLWPTLWALWFAGEGRRAQNRAEGSEADAARRLFQEGAAREGQPVGRVKAEKVAVVAVHSRVTVSSRLSSTLVVTVQAAS